MKPNVLAERVEQIISSAEESLYGTLSKVQRRAYGSTLSILKELDVDDSGYIKVSEKNRALIQRAAEKYNESLSSKEYKSGINAYAESVNQISAVNAAYFKAISDTFKPNSAFIKSIRNEALKQVESLALNEGLVVNVKRPLLKILNNNINGGGSFAGFLEQVRAYTIGNDSDGKLLRYARTWTSDVLFTYARAYQQASSNDLGLEWYLYSGGVIKKSRAFCRERFEQYWHKLEIESWAEQDWSGRHPETTTSSIFQLLGGYNCRHSLIPVSEFLVPEEVLARMK